MKQTKNEDFGPIVTIMFYDGGPLCVPNWVPAEIGLASPHHCVSQFLFLSLSLNRMYNILLVLFLWSSLITTLLHLLTGSF